MERANHKFVSRTADDEQGGRQRRTDACKDSTGINTCSCLSLYQCCVRLSLGFTCKNCDSFSLCRVGTHNFYIPAIIYLHTLFICFLSAMTEAEGRILEWIQTFNSRLLVIRHNSRTFIHLHFSIYSMVHAAKSKINIKVGTYAAHLKVGQGYKSSRWRPKNANTLNKSFPLTSSLTAKDGSSGGNNADMSCTY